MEKDMVERRRRKARGLGQPGGAGEGQGIEQKVKKITKENWV